MTTDGELAITQRQNEIIIALLARLAFGEGKIVEMVTRGKRKPDAYRKVYNALDGKTTGTELAGLAGVTPQAMSYTLQAWEQEGIAINMGTESQPKFKNLMNIPVVGGKKRETKN